ncbi:hypothetical protein [Spongiactinospora sp. 9N601]|uniref:hypothetical protein n=1 Tax=Spongiactinospora sp. 9N601 TaxID=3375149 RepID=UPI0037B1C9A7
MATGRPPAARRLQGIGWAAVMLGVVVAVGALVAGAAGSLVQAIAAVVVGAGASVVAITEAVIVIRTRRTQRDGS